MKMPGLKRSKVSVPLKVDAEGWGYVQFAKYILHQKLGLLIIVCCLSASCDNRKEKTPDYLLDEDKMVAVMIDMHVVEAANNLKLIPGDSTYQADFASIFASHGTTKADYDSSLFYYATRTEKMNGIYDRVLEDMYELESEVSPMKEQQGPP